MNTLTGPTPQQYDDMLQSMDQLQHLHIIKVTQIMFCELVSKIRLCSGFEHMCDVSSCALPVIEYLQICPHLCASHGTCIFNTWQARFHCLFGMFTTELFDMILHSVVQAMSLIACMSLNLHSTLKVCWSNPGQGACLDL